LGPGGAAGLAGADAHVYQLVGAGELLDLIAGEVLQRILALTVTIWHNDHTGQPIMRSLVTCDH
jgi:hypothetical protein